MAEGLSDHQKSNESGVCDDVIDVPDAIPSLLDKQAKVSIYIRFSKKEKDPPSGKRCKGAVASEPHVS